MMLKYLGKKPKEESSDASEITQILFSHVTVGQVVNGGVQVKSTKEGNAFNQSVKATQEMIYLVGEYTEKYGQNIHVWKMSTLIEFLKKLESTCK